MDSPTDTHRHLSHLIGLYPGYAVSSYNSSLQALPLGRKAYSKSEVAEAAEMSLIHRGNGTGPDGDAGWEKVWRAAAWAQLGNSSQFYHQLSVSISYYHRVDSCIRLIGYSMLLKEIMARTYSVCTTHSTRIPHSRSTQISDIRLLS